MLVSRGLHLSRFALIQSLAVALACASCAGAPSAETYEANSPTGYNVVLVTLDGVRWQELFEGSDPLLTANAAPVFPLLWEKLASRGVVYGDPRAGSEMRVATSANASLPGYASIYAETSQGCLTNSCGRITVPTFVDRLSDELELPREQLAVFASWSKMRLAVTGRDDVAFVSAGVDPASAGGDPEHEHEAFDPAFDFDRGTASAGLEYLDQHHPRFLHLALLDSDRYGHQNRYQRYVEVLRAYDRLLADLVEHLEGSGVYGRRTAIVITTDHGRGLWDQWAEHGPQTPASANVWAVVVLPREATELSLLPASARVFNHHDVRYTIETLFGLSTKSSAHHSTGFVTRSGTP